MIDYSETDILAEVEDSLQAHLIFYNGISGKPCHCDSYMTCVNFSLLAKWFESQSFGVDILNYCLHAWKTYPNMQLPLKIVAIFLTHKQNPDRI